MITQKFYLFNKAGQREKSRISKDLFAIKNWLNDNFPTWNMAKKDILEEAKNLEKQKEEMEIKEKLAIAEKENQKKERVNKIFGKIGFVCLIPLVIIMPPIFYWFSFFNKYIPKWFRIAGGGWLLITCSLYYFTRK